MKPQSPVHPSRPSQAPARKSPRGLLDWSALILAIVLMWTSAPATAHISDPIMERGFKPDQVYKFLDMDAVNTFNGNLSLTLPLGGSYPVNAGFSYGLSLYYSSGVWDLEHRCAGQSNSSWTPVGAWDPTCGTNAYPNRKSNAGMGWSVNLGTLLPPQLHDPKLPATFLNSQNHWLYIGPDGGEHTFHQKLHPNVGGVQPTGAEYSTDGTYMRLKVVGGDRIVESPDGTRRIFRQAQNSSFPGGWRLEEIRDAFGNGLTISYTQNEMLWTLTDDHGREHFIEFEGAGSVEYYDRRIKEVRVAKFGGGWATYGFHYTTLNIHPGCPQTPAGTAPTKTILVLDSLHAPEGLVYDFQYESDETTAYCSRYNGRLNAMVLPTGGKVTWEYGGFPFSRAECVPASAGGGPGQTPDSNWHIAYGVRKRSLYLNAGDPQPHGVWEHQSFPNEVLEINLGAGTCDPVREQASVLVEPIEGARVKLTRTFYSVFHTGPGTDPEGFSWDRAEYGLAMSRKRPDPRDNGLYLSTEIFECDQRPGDLADPDLAGCQGGAAAVPERRFYTAWEHSGEICPGGGNICSPANRRTIGEATFYLDDQPDNPAAAPDGIIGESRSLQFDWLGHHCRQETWGNFINEGGDPKKVSITRYGVNGDATTCGDVTPTLPAFDDPWLLNLYYEQRIEESGDGATTRFAFDPQNGFLLERRALVGSSGTSAEDLRVVYTPDGDGNVAREDYFGGDLANAGASSPEFTKVHSYDRGVLRTSAWVQPGNPNQPEILRLVDQTLDPHTGLVVTAVDSAGVGHTLSYDELGRITSAVATDIDERPAAVEYINRAGGQPAKVRLTRTGTHSNTSESRERTIHYDGLGRPVEEISELAGGVTSRVVTSYLPSGQLEAVSTPQPGGSGSIYGLPRTTYRDYDAFGRARKIWPASRTASTPDLTEMTYSGIRKRSEKVWRLHVRNSSNGQPSFQSATRRFTSDAFGRLRIVNEHSNPDGSAVNTRYEYDYADRLTSARTNGQPARLFAYDRRGFKTQENQLEAEAASYAGYDALGNVGTRTVQGAGGALFDLDFYYDKAGRPTQVWQFLGGSSRLLQELVYAPQSDRAVQGDDKRAGKLVRAKQHHYLTLNGVATDVVVSQGQTYAGVQGRMSEQWVGTDGSGLLPRTRFTTRYEYNGLGNVTRIDYPECLHPGCGPGEGVPDRPVVREFDYGMLSGVPGLTHSLTYFPNGMLAEIDRTNAVKDVIENDPQQLSRPRSISTQGVAGDENWQSGTYLYDGGQNIWAIGTDLYLYDKVGRLLQGSVTKDGVAYTESLGYDRYGNLTTIQRTNQPLQLMVPDSNTNRLTQATYDAAGNVIDTGDFAYGYDALSRMISADGGGAERHFLYTVGGERLATLSEDASSRSERWTIRDGDNQVLRDLTFEHGQVGEWSWNRDYVRRGSRVLAAYLPPDTQGGAERTRHYHLDHLGSTRLVTDENGARVNEHAYYPFGWEVPFAEPGERIRFTNHERDDFDPTGQSGDLDYMHARYYSAGLGRFLAVDPLDSSARTGLPQSWNRYSYVLGNPLLLTDPTGEKDVSTKLAGLYRKGANLLRNSKSIARAVASVYNNGSAVGALQEAAANTSIDLAENLGLFDSTDVAADLLQIGTEAGQAVGSGAHRDEVIKAFSRDAGTVGEAILEFMPSRRAGAKASSGAINSTLPLDKHGRKVPDTTAPHTQLGERTSDRRNETYRQAREWGQTDPATKAPIPVRDIEFTDHGRRDHANPHQHPYNQSTGKREGAEPLPDG